MIASVVVDWVVPAILFVLVVIAAWIGILWTSSEELAALRSAPLFNGLSTRQLRSILATAHPVTFSPREQLTSQGEPGVGRVGPTPAQVARHRLVTCQTEETLAASRPHRSSSAEGRALKEVEMRLGNLRGRRTVWRLFAVAAVFALVSTACSKGSSSSSSSLTTVFVQKFRFHGMPTTLSSGYHQFLFQNKESFQITHEMIPVALPSGKKVQDIISDAKDKGADSEDDWLHIGGDFGSVDTGAGIVETIYLPVGTYAIACWQTGTTTGEEHGPPHAAKGMVFQFTVT